ncbi:MAG TPA: hypothetical protein PKE30_08080 [Niabella sp.]|nr:hypothetical protein [Niabella sp.]
MDAVRKIIEKYTNPQENQPENGLSKFLRKLEWKGDALAEQRKLRDEWE